MRVIAGTAGSLKLETPDSMDTRPTTDRIKETLFNIISPEISGCRFLDMFSGSGAIAIEALSRGASEAYLVEHDKKAVCCIERNLKFTHLDKKAVILNSDAVSSIDIMERRKVYFDIVFLDPPYGQQLEERVLEKLTASDIIDKMTTIIIESGINTDYSYADRLGFEIYRVKKYKTNKHTFLYRR